MAYSKRTTFYHLPVPADGDMLTEEQETIKLGMVDGLLHAALLGCGRLMMEEGSYSVEWNESMDVGRLVIAADSNGHALMGLLNHRLFYSVEPVELNGLGRNGVYHVYAEYSSGLEENFSYFSIRKYLEGMDILPDDSDRTMELCVVDTRNVTQDNPGTVSVSDKTRTSSILAHTAVSSNPHGRSMTQENLSVTGRLEVSGGFTIGGKDARPGYVEFETGGVSGTVVASSGEPAFVSLSAKGQGAGEMWWTYSGGVLTAFNSGSSGVPAAARIDYV